MINKLLTIYTVVGTTLSIIGYFKLNQRVDIFIPKKKTLNLSGLEAFK